MTYRSTVTIYLIGLRGSGKSTAGRLASSRRGWVFADLDDVTPRVAGFPTVREAWSSLGERGFRRAERRALDDEAVRSAACVALGGGTPMHESSREELARRRDLGAAIVYLRADEAELRRRLSGADNTHRPSLTGADPLAEIGVVLARRDPVYRLLASRVIEVAGLSPEQVASEIEAVAATRSRD